MARKNCVQKYSELLSKISSRDVIIFGAGNYGCKLCLKLRKDIPSDKIAFCDNDPEKQGTRMLGYPVYSVEDAAGSYENAVFLIMIRGVEDHKRDGMFEQIAKLVKEDQIIAVPQFCLYTESKEALLCNDRKYIQDLLRSSRKMEELEEVKEVKSITFRNRLKDGTGGGPAKVLEMQEKALGYELGARKLSYQYKIENEVSLGLDHALGGYLGAVQFARQIGQEDRQVVYVAHDIFSAFGLASCGKHYILVYHSQGEAVAETRNMGNQISEEEEELLKQIELESIQKAEYVCFPSRGAEEFFWKSWGIQDIPEYSQGSPLYNCLVRKDMETYESVEGLYSDKAVCTILSIGQMTYAKGMDRIPEFLEKLSCVIKMKIRWIVVAQGPLKEKVLEDVKRLSEKNENINCIHFDKLKHSQINYLFSISDGYLMLHRISVFDIATLEAMYHNLFIMLSDIPGNREYNLQDNIILIPEKADYMEIAKRIQDDRKNNREIYDMEFDMSRFRQRYAQMISLLAEKSMQRSKAHETI